jgi:CheY-like chemotaxis protein
VSLSKKAVLRFELEPDTPPIEADSAQIQQVVMNLITNASDALEDRTGVITLRTGVAEHTQDELRKFTLGEPLKPGRFVYLEVKDTGCGMDKSTLQRMFDPFFTTKFAGRGLGLASVLGIVRSHHGGLHVSSRPGAGTSFRIIIPAATHEAPAPDTSGHNGSNGAPAGGTLLVVDDEPRVLDLVARALGRSGYNVLTAKDGPAAIELFRQHSDDVCGVVIDWTMPGMSGEEVLTALRRKNRNLPALFISGYAASEMAPGLPDEGRSAFLQKPFSIEVLRQTVESLLSAAANGAKAR